VQSDKGVGAGIFMGVVTFLAIGAWVPELFSFVGGFAESQGAVINSVLFLLTGFSPVWAPILVGIIVSRTVSRILAPPLPPPTTPPQCPKCKSVNHHVVDTSESSGTYETTETRTRETRRYNADGDYIGHEETDYEVPVTRHYSTTWYRHECKSCGHKWSDTKS
jgi:hypothetical protein